MLCGIYDSEGKTAAYDKDGNRLYKIPGFQTTTNPNAPGATPGTYQDNDSGQGCNARLFFYTGPAGDYYIDAWRGGSTGTYTLAVTLVSCI